MYAYLKNIYYLKYIYHRSEFQLQCAIKNVMYLFNYKYYNIKYILI